MKLCKKINKMLTLKNEIKLSGIGLHSGKISTVRLLPSDICGITFKTTNGLYDLSTAVVEEDSRLTGFSLPDGTLIRTAEHLLASIVGMELDAVTIVLEGEEVPIMDGSSYSFASAINETGYSDVSGEIHKKMVSTPIVVENRKENKIISVFPSENLRVTYIIEYPDTPIGVQKVSYDITREAFLKTISKARTFGLTYELDFLKKANLAKGGSLNNALVFGKDTLLNKEGLHFTLECVTHKVVDLLGDLALVGSIPIGHYLGICTGHAMHKKLVERLKRTNLY